MTTTDDMDDEEADMHLAKLQVASAVLMKRQLYVYSPVRACFIHIVSSTLNLRMANIAEKIEFVLKNDF